MAPTLPYDLQGFRRPGDFELQRRGLFRTAYTGRTLREHLGLPRPAHPAQLHRRTLKPRPGRCPGCLMPCGPARYPWRERGIGPG